MSLTTIIRKAIRIARIRNDYENLLWLEYEMINFKDTHSRNRLKSDIAIHFDKQSFDTLKRVVIEAYISERQCAKVEDGRLVEGDTLCGLGVHEIEIQVDNLIQTANNAVPPKGLDPKDLYKVQQSESQLREFVSIMAEQYKQILARIGHRVYDFLSATEKQLLYGQFHSNLFERNRQYVNNKLLEISPETFEQLTSAYRRLEEGDVESNSHALTSCRRALKSVADRIYPPRIESVIGPDGRIRKLTEDKYIARLWQFISEQLGKTTSGELLSAQIKDIGDRLDRVYDLSCKGVHTDVSEFEVNQCVLQTYFLLGDILRLVEGNSGVNDETKDIE